MNPSPDPTPEAELRTLLRTAHPTPVLPPRFQEGVWRRLERGERSRPTPGRLESLFAALVRPAYAGIGLAVVMIAGVGLGLRDGGVANLRAEQARYLAAVSPLHQTP